MNGTLGWIERLVQDLRFYHPRCADSAWAAVRHWPLVSARDEPGGIQCSQRRPLIEPLLHIHPTETLSLASASRVGPSSNNVRLSRDDISSGEHNQTFGISQGLAARQSRHRLQESAEPEEVRTLVSEPMELSRALGVTSRLWEGDSRRTTIRQGTARTVILTHGVPGSAARGRDRALIGTANHQSFVDSRSREVNPGIMHRRVFRFPERGPGVVLPQRFEGLSSATQRRPHVSVGIARPAARRPARAGPMPML